MQTPAKRARIVRFGAWLILAFVLMPNISYMGHWPEMATGIMDHHSDGAAMAQDLSVNGLDAEAEAHAAHCHVGPANCGGGESMVGTPFIGDDGGGLALPGYEAFVESKDQVTSLNGHAVPLLQPPRAI